jgi:uncharacterized membrane protein
MRLGPASTRARWTAGAVAALAYAAASHGLMTAAQDSAWSMAVVLGPLVVLGTAALWRSGQRTLAIAGATAALGVAVMAATGRSVPARWLYLAQHAGIHLALGIWFGSTLRRGAQPLITQLARKVHRSFTPVMTVYTRQVTVAWTVYFFAMATASLALFFGADFRHWSLLANIVTPVLTAGLFVGEYVVRYWLHPDFERVSLQLALQAWQGKPTESAVVAPGALDR